MFTWLNYPIWFGLALPCIWTNVIRKCTPKLRHEGGTPGPGQGAGHGGDRAAWDMTRSQPRCVPVPAIATRGRDKNTMAIKYQIVTISEIYSVTILRFLRTQHFMLTVTVGCCAVVRCAANLILHSKKHKNVKTLHFPLILLHVLWWQPIEMQSGNQVIKTTGPNFVFDWIFVEYLRYRRIAWEMRIKRFAKTHIFASTIIWKINNVVEISNNVPHLSIVPKRSLNCKVDLMNMLGLQRVDFDCM